jgi:hypothetical protein
MMVLQQCCYCEIDVGLQFDMKICCKVDENAPKDFGSYTPEFGDTGQIFMAM